MTSITPTYPNLGSWEKNISVIADRILSDAFVAEYSQSYLFQGNITSIPYIIQNYSKDITVMCNEMEKSLNRLFSRYFVTNDNNASKTEVYERPTDKDLREIVIYINFTYDNVVYTYNRLLEVKDNIIQNVIILNNTQPEY